MAEDRLARLIYDAVLNNTEDLPDLGGGAEAAAAAVRAHIAAAFDATEEEWAGFLPRERRRAGPLAGLRAVLGLEAET